MQPCTVCGGGSVNQAGYCLHCGTFRGLPPAPHSYPPQPAAQPGYPVRPAPGYSVAASPANRGRSYLVPLVALGSTFAVLVVAIGVVLAARAGGDGDRTTADPTASPTPTAFPTTSAAASAPIDPCVVGSWRVDSYVEDLALDEPFGRTRFTGVGPGALVELREDGLGATDYGDADDGGTAFEGEVAGITVTLTLTGRVTYRYRAVDGTVSFTDVREFGDATLTAPGIDPQTDDLDVDLDPANYECAGDTMTQSTTFYTAQLSRR